jgi:hypothetical protein
MISEQPRRFPTDHQAASVSGEIAGYVENVRLTMLYSDNRSIPKRATVALRAARSSKASLILSFDIFC